jgi:hypothetical protein
LVLYASGYEFFSFILKDVYNWIIDVCHVVFYEISENFGIIIDFITGLFDCLIEAFLMIPKIIYFELEGLNASIEISFSEILDTLVDGLSTLKKDEVDISDKLCGWFGLC